MGLIYNEGPATHGKLQHQLKTKIYFDHAHENHKHTKNPHRPMNKNNSLIMKTLKHHGTMTEINNAVKCILKKNETLLLSI